MQALRRTLMAVVVLAPALASAGKPGGGGTTGPAFVTAFTTARPKIADPVGDNALYGGGQHAMQLAGNQLVVAFPDYQDDGQSVWVARSLDGGATWLPAARAGFGSGISSTGAPLAIGPDPAGAGKYRVHVIWMARPVNTTAASIYYAYATLDPSLGKNALGYFSYPVNVTGGAIASSYGELTVAADGMGGVHIAAGGWVDGAPGVMYSRSADYGATFVETGVLVAPGAGRPALAATATGEAFLAYELSPGSYVARRAQGAAAFDAPVLVTPTGRAEISLAAADANRLYLAWVYDEAPLYSSRYHVARSTDGGQSWAIFHSATAGLSLFGPSIAVSATGTVGVAFSDYGTDIGTYVRSTDGGVTWSGPATIAPMTWGATLLFDAAGKANLAFVESANGGGAIYFAKEK